MGWGDYQNGKFVEILVRGLHHLTSLASVTLQPDWASKKDSSYQDIEADLLWLAAGTYSTLDYADGLSNMTRARIEVQLKRGAIESSHLISPKHKSTKANSIWPESADDSRCLPPYVFVEFVQPSPRQDITAFSGLELYDITRAHYGDRHHYGMPGVPENVKNVRHFQLLLASMD